MDENRFSPNFANILASLRIKGATVKGGRGKDGFLPVLGVDGTLDLSVIPLDALQRLVDVLPLKNTAFVDANAVLSEDEPPTGSIVRPFKTLTSAAANGFCNFILIGGTYDTERVIIHNNSNEAVRIFSLGSSIFPALTFEGYSDGTRFDLNGIFVDSTLTFAQNVNCSVTALGAGAAGKIYASDPETTLVNVMTSDDFVVGATQGPVTVGYIASSDRVANDSTVAGVTVSDALDKLSIRKIRIPIFASDEHGLKITSSHDIEVGSDDKYSLDGLEYGLGALVKAINDVFHKNGDDVSYGNITATQKVTSPSVVGTSVTAGALKFGAEGSEKAVVSVDSDNFLVIASPGA